MVRLRIYVISLIFSSPFLCSCQKIDPARNKITFNDNIETVQDSLMHMQTLLEKLPKTYRVNYFVDPEGYLYVNNTKLGYLKRAINNSKIRRDMSFEKFSDTEYRSFFWLMSFLVRNYIDASYYDESIKRFVFVYRKVDDPSYSTIRLIVVNTEDSFQANIRGQYQILDQSLKLKLLAPHDVKIK